MRHLVIGGAGFIGSHLVDQLISTGASEIVVVDDFSLGTMFNLRQALHNFPNLEVINQDATDIERLKSKLSGRFFDNCFNLGVVPLPASLVYPSRTAQTNFDLAVCGVEMVRNDFAERLIHFSSSEVYGSASYVPMNEDHPANISTPYAASKYAGDMYVLSMVKTFRLPAFIVRPFNNIGPRQNARDFAGIIPRLCRAAVTNVAFEMFGSGKQTRDFIAVEDTARIVSELQFTEIGIGEVVNIGSGVETSIEELVRIAKNTFEDLTIQPSDSRPADVQRHVADTRKLRVLLPDVSFTAVASQVTHTLQWYQEHWEEVK